MKYYNFIIVEKTLLISHLNSDMKKKKKIKLKKDATCQGDDHTTGC